MEPYDSEKHLFLSSNEHYEFASKHIKGKTVLDVGCGFGSLIPYLNDVEYTGIDATKHFVDKANDSRISFCDVMDYEGRFDTVCALGVLDTAIDLKPLGKKLLSIAKYRVISSFHEGECIPKAEFKKHTKEEILEAFGEVSFHKAETTKEIYFIKEIGNG